MRLGLALCCLVVGVGCAGPHSTGAMWAQQNVEREAALFKLSDAQRAEQAHALELSLADESLATERARLTTELQACPGQRQAWSVSSGDMTRDAIRVRVQGDPQRLSAVAQLALADWRLRRAHARGDSHWCQGARDALAGATSFGEPSSSDLLTRLPAATVSRNPRSPTPQLDSAPAIQTLSNYALGYVDVVRAAAPLPHYLALVYGGFLYESGSPPAMDDETAADTVDREALAYPQWEPDALYAALRGVHS